MEDITQPPSQEAISETASLNPVAAVKAAEHDLIYGLEDKPPVRDAIFAAVQHVLACFVGIITPSLIVAGALGLDPADAAFVVSMSLFVSGVATFIQARRFGPVGSGLLSIQGTSFAFIGPILGAGTAATSAGRSPTEALGLIFGLCFFGAFIEIIFSRFLHLASKIITPLVTGIVVTLIGLTLINVGITSVGGGFPAREAGTFGSLMNIGVAALVLVTILVVNSANNALLRMASIAIGLMVGYLVAWPLGMLSFDSVRELPAFAFPIPFRYGMGFDFAAFIPFAFLYLITAIESIGDLTATSLLTGQPIAGPKYMKRIKGGVLADGINSLIAACFCTFPNTTFSQNNGVIQLTGIGSRYVGYYIAGVFVLMGIFPVFGGIFQAMPQPVLGGATLVMFGTVAAAGIKILSCVNFTKRASLITAISLGIGLGVTYPPDILDNFPALFRNIFSSGISAGGLSALMLNLVLPGPRD